MSFTPTPEQLDFIDKIKTGENVTVRALAGAGKTTSLVLASTILPGKGIFTAFNRKIVEDSKQKFDPSRVTAATLHSFAFRAMCTGPNAWRAARMGKDVPRLHGYRLAKALGANDPYEVKTDLVHKMFSPGDLASLALVAIDKWCDSDQDRPQWWHIPARPGLDAPEVRKGLFAAVLPLMQRAWADLTNPKGTLRRTHSHYLKEWAMTSPQLPADYFMLDEAQDTNGVTMQIVRAQRNMQIATVGDENQSIYGWRGSVDAMSAFDGLECAFTQSFRFGPAVADQANIFLEFLDSDLRVKGFDKVNSVVGPIDTPDAILTRTNAEAVAQAIRFQAEGRKVALLGGGFEIGRMAEAAEKLMNREWTNHPDFTAFETWGQVQDYVENDPTGADLAVFVRLVDKYGTAAIREAMDNLSAERYAEVTLSTAHKCKGAEWSAVKIGSDFSEPKRTEDGEYELSREAMMLNYVAVTRAKTALDVGGLSWGRSVLAEVRGDRAGRMTDEDVAASLAVIGEETNEVTAAQAQDQAEATECGLRRTDGRYPAQTCQLPAGHDGDVHGPRGWDRTKARAYFWTESVAVPA